MDKIYDLFITILIIQIVSYGFCTVFNIGINTNITYDFPVFENVSLINILISFWNIFKFLILNIFFSFLSYDSFFLQMVNLALNILTWFCMFEIGKDTVYKLKPT